MIGKPESYTGDQNENPPRETTNTRIEWPWTPETHAKLCQALLTANTLKDVLRASLQIILPTDVSGVAILLCAGPTDDRHLEVATSWERDGHRVFPSDVQFSTQDHLFQPLSTSGQPIVVDDLATDTRVSEYIRSVFFQAEIRALVMLPLGSAQSHFGALLIVRSETLAFDPESIRVYEAVVDLIRGSIEKHWLVQDTQQELNKASALYGIGQRLLKAQSINDILLCVIDSDLFGAASGTIALLEPSTSGSDCSSQELVFCAAAGAGAEKILGMRMPATEGVVGWVVRENELALVPDAYTDERFYPRVDQHIDFLTQTILCAPLRVEDKVIGAIELVDVPKQYLSKEGIQLLGQVADQAALLIEKQRLLEENRRLFSQTNEALQETRLLYQASRALTQAQDLNDVLRTIADSLPAEQINQCWIALIDPDSADYDNPKNRVIEISAIWDRDGDHSLMGRRFTSQELPAFARVGVTETFVSNDLDNETDLDAETVATLRSLGAKSALIVPLKTGESLFGWLVLLAHDYKHAFDRDQIRPYLLLADQAAIAIHNQRLLQKVQHSLEEVETVHRQYLRHEWESFLQSKAKKSTAFAYDQGALLTSQDLWHPLIEEALSQDTLVTQSCTSGGRIGDGSSDQAGGSPEYQDGASLVTLLKVRGQVIGALGLEAPDQVHEWTADEVIMVQEIADRVAQAVENARLLEETQTSLAETEHLYKATGRLSDASTAKEVIEILAQEFHTALGPAFSGSILRAGPNPAGQIEWLEQSAEWNSSGIAVSQGARFFTTDYPALSRVLEHRDPLNLENSALNLGENYPQEMLDGIRLRTRFAIPLVAGNSWLGVINIASHEAHTPDGRTMRFLQNLANRAAAALESVRLYSETRRRAVQLEAGVKVSRAATSILEQDRLLSDVVELIRDHFDYYHAQVFVLDPSERWAVLAASTGEVGQRLLACGYALEVGDRSLIGQATDSGEPAYAYDSEDGSFSTQNPELPHTRSELAIPLQIGGQVIGALDVHSTEPAAFGSDDIAVLSTLADQLAVAIENARLYQEQLETAKELREVDRLKTQFLANMSHELRTPLNSIIGFSRVILKGIDGPLTDLQKQDLTAIYHSGKLLLRLINDVLDISKIAAGKMELAFEELDLREIIRGVLSTATALTKDKSQIEVRHNIADDLPPIIADATRLRQVLLNLLSNAVKFTEAGFVELRVTHDPNFVTIQVSDTGIGIPAEKFDLIFQEFEQVDGSTTRAVGGTGLGLPISRHFVEMHGGRIWVESKVGVGSTFSMQLPIKGPQTAEETGDEPAIDSGRRLVLAVDDDADAIRFYKRYLEQHNYQVIGVLESEDAAQKAHELRPYAILLDILMPKKDGWTVIQELKSNPETRDIPVIICSLVNAAGRGFSLGAADFLIKPVTEERLLAALAHLENGATHGPGEPRRVLIIDDTPEDRMLLRRTLESAREPYHVIEANSALEGITIIQHEQPDLVILDLIMPQMDGFAVVEALKSDKEMRQIPIIVVTAKELTQHERAQINGRVAALFQKGLFKEDELFQDLNRALHRIRTPRQTQYLYKPKEKKEEE